MPRTSGIYNSNLHHFLYHLFYKNCITLRKKNEQKEFVAKAPIAGHINYEFYYIKFCSNLEIWNIYTIKGCKDIGIRKFEIELW